MTEKEKDFWIVSFLLILGSTISLLLNLKNISHGFLFLGIPSMFLLYRNKKNINLISWGVLIFGLILGAFFDYFMVLNHAWEVNRLTFKLFVFFDFWAAETVIGYIWMTLFILVFYEHFFETDKHRHIKRSPLKLLIISFVILLIIFVTGNLNPDILKIKYAYFFTGLIVIIFPIIFLIRNPKMLKKFAPLSLYFFFVWFLLENVGMRLSGWEFNGSVGSEYVGLVSFFNITFPIEEILFWMIWYPVTIVSFYESFLDDGK